MPRRPTQFGAQPGRVDRVTAVVARTVPDPVERVLVLPHHPQDHAQYGDVVPLAVRADQVRLADTALRQDRPHARTVILGVDPVAHVLALAVQLRTLPVQDVRDLTRDELLHMLERPVIVRAVRDRGMDAVRARPRAHQHVRRRLRRRIRAGRMVRGMLRELRRIVQCEVAVHLVRAHVMVADPVLAHRLQQTERALHVGPQERFRIRDGIVVVRLGRVMHDRVMPRHDPVQKVGVADVAHHELHTILGKARDVLRIARVRELVQNGHMHVRMVLDHVMHEIRPDETTTTSHNDVFRSKRLFNHRHNHNEHPRIQTIFSREPKKIDSRHLILVDSYRSSIRNLLVEPLCISNRQSYTTMRCRLAQLVCFGNNIVSLPHSCRYRME